MSRLAGLSKNLSAFLDMIAHSEGTIRYGDDDGYNVLVGGDLFHSYADHPRLVVFVRPGLVSTAAGRYQLLERYFNAYKAQLHLTDFSPESQDKIAIQQIRECRAIPSVEIGNFPEAVKRCAHIWASLPGAGYGQRENTLEALQKVFVTCGGELIA